MIDMAQGPSLRDEEVIFFFFSRTDRAITADARI